MPLAASAKNCAHYRGLSEIQLLKLLFSRAPIAGCKNSLGIIYSLSQSPFRVATPSIKSDQATIGGKLQLNLPRQVYKNPGLPSSFRLPRPRL